MRGYWAVTGGKGRQGSSSLSIEVGIDLWQLSIKVCESRATRWESSFPSPAEDGQGLRIQLPEKSHKSTVTCFCILQHK